MYVGNKRTEKLCTQKHSCINPLLFGGRGGITICVRDTESNGASWDIPLKENSARASSGRKPIGTGRIFLSAYGSVWFFFISAVIKVSGMRCRVMQKKITVSSTVAVICIVSRIILKLLPISTTVCFRSFEYREQISVERECCPTRLTYWKTHPRDLTYSMIGSLSLCYGNSECYPVLFPFPRHPWISR